MKHVQEQQQEEWEDEDQVSSLSIYFLLSIFLGRWLLFGKHVQEQHVSQTKYLQIMPPYTYHVIAYLHS
jgi:hypothetical protein